jgi:hypothetical protein
MQIRHPLINELQRKIEKTYALDTGITNIEQYIIGDKGYKEFYAKEEIVTVVKSHSGAKVLIRDAGDTLKVSIYYPDELIRELEDNEELDHFLFIAQNYKQHRPFSLLELELQANVTKYLILKYFVALQNKSLKLSKFDKEYIRYHLFYKRKYDIEDASERKRYEDAGKFGMIYTKYIDLLSQEDRLRDLRQFSRMTCPSKIRHIQSTMN